MHFEGIALQWSNRLKQIALCHRLKMVSKSAVTGHNVEVQLLKAVEALLLGMRPTVPAHLVVALQLEKLHMSIV